MGVAGDKAEVVYPEPWVKLLRIFLNSLAAGVGLLVIHINRVHMYGHHNAKLFENITLNAVYHVVGGNEILIAAHLRMAACQLLSGAVVVDYQVMHADYLVGSGDDILYLFDKLVVGGLADKVIYSVLNDAEAALDDEY